MSSALVDLDIPPRGDTTASYVALSRVRTREDLFILRDFDTDQLRRGGTKAGVDILLRRLRGDLDRFTEGSKQCAACRRMKPRSGFVSTDTMCTRQWNAHKSANRRCLQCLASERTERDKSQRKRVCNAYAAMRRTHPSSQPSNCDTTATPPCAPPALLPATGSPAPSASLPQCHSPTRARFAAAPRRRRRY
eukprot:gene19259-biopygen29520